MKGLSMVFLPVAEPGPLHRMSINYGRLEGFKVLSVIRKLLSALVFKS